MSAGAEEEVAPPADMGTAGGRGGPQQRARLREFSSTRSYISSVSGGGKGSGIGRGVCSARWTAALAADDGRRFCDWRWPGRRATSRRRRAGAARRHAASRRSARRGRCCARGAERWARPSVGLSVRGADAERGRRRRAQDRARPSAWTCVRAKPCRRAPGGKIHTAPLPHRCGFGLQIVPALNAVPGCRPVARRGGRQPAGGDGGLIGGADGGVDRGRDDRPSLALLGASPSLRRPSSPAALVQFKRAERGAAGGAASARARLGGGDAAARA